MGDLADFLLAGGQLGRCAIYTRQSVSSDEGLSSCQVQFETCESFVCSQRPVGWLPLSERFDDEGYSGATNERPALQRLLALVRTRKVEQVVIHRLDRLSRSVLGCATVLQELREFGVGLAIVTALELGHNAHDGFILNMLASFAEFEREMIAGRIAESRARLKARGLRIAGAVPFGFEADPRSKQLVPVEQEAVIVGWMFERAATGETPAFIAAAANAHGWKTKLRIGRRSGKHDGGVAWTARQVVATLRNPVYLGQFREKQGVRFGKHDPIVTSDVFAAAAAQLEARRTRTPGKRYEIEWHLKGRIVCAVCDRPMSPHTIRYRNVLYRYYRCRSTAGGRQPCGHQVSAQAIENAVERNVFPELAQESQLWDSIELAAYNHRDGGIRVRLIRPGNGEQPVARDASSKRAGASMLQYEDYVSLRPKFRITNAITGNLTRVERARGFLDAAK